MLVGCSDFCHALQAMVGRTGNNVDAHLAKMVHLYFRPGHSDLFHCYDGVGRPVLSHRGDSKREDEKDSSSSSSDENTDCTSFLEKWTRTIRLQRKFLHRGQGRVFLKQAFQKHHLKQKPGIQIPGGTRYVVYAGAYLRQSLKHFSAPSQQTSSKHTLPPWEKEMISKKRLGLCFGPK